MAEFLGAAEDALEQQRWTAAGLNAVHAGISGADAAIVAVAGVRSAAKDHGAVVDLLRKSVPNIPTAQIRQLTGLLAMKNGVEYEQRLLTETEARTLVQHAQRFCTWSSGIVNQETGAS